MNAARLCTVVLALAGLTAVTTHALAYCPTSETARDGFALVGPEGRMRLEVKPSSDEIVSQDLFIGGKLVSSPTYYKGIYLIQAVDGTATSIASYDFDYTREPDLNVGFQKTFHVTLTTPDGKATTSAVNNRIVAREKIVLGDCTLETLVLEGQTASPNKPMQTRRSHFSPELRAFVRSTITTDGAPPVVIVYDHIEPGR